MKVYILSEEVGRQIVIALELGKDGRRKSRDALMDDTIALLQPTEVPDDAEELAIQIQRRDNDENPQLTVDEAAALITAHSRMVPRAMLSRIVSYTAGMMDWNGEVDDDLFIDDIAKEFGYRAE